MRYIKDDLILLVTILITVLCEDFLKPDFISSSVHVWYLQNTIDWFSLFVCYWDYKSCLVIVS